MSTKAESPVPPRCICNDGFGMNLSCPHHGVGQKWIAPKMPANPPSAAPMDLDALERLAVELRDAIAACNPFKFTLTPFVAGSPEMTAEQSDVWRAYGALTAACTPERILALVAAARRGVEDTARIEWLEKHANPVHAAVLSFPAKVRDGATGRSFEAESIRAAIDAARAHPPIQETDDDA